MSVGSGKFLDVDRLRGWIGREETVTDTVDADLVRKFNAALDLPVGQPATGDVAPLLIHFCLGQPAVPTGQLGGDGHPQKGGFLPLVPLPRRMWAGGSLRFSDDLKVGDTVRRVSRIAEVSVKDGRSGTLCFVTVDHRFDIDGRVVIEERQDIVYREAATGGPAAKPAAPAEPVAPGTHRRVVTPGAPLLFRYSALTFNGHRIHYDRAYARDVELYPGLVVHGPLQATLLLHFAAELKGGAPASFSFRGQSPLFDDDRINLHAVERDGTLSLWTMRDGGPVAMSAEARWV
ncbi:MaoC family dehydratase N-terminal domain-containing protein [Pseudorhizobium flavum]|uniref:3-methylfumaryl-CoA hydratase n=1 Tax=Pseudorhizobium flavum TaxID=1335061 RepID=A0A7W9Z2F8_9HYPH|nr:MaoC family dehydratase N-terminal domain-containing protein [Pseudorhizobium flavum]MBB6181921.1 3-methylfumaryl-CoA hydratase [Pseudorhizobium flavum]